MPNLPRGAATNTLVIANVLVWLAGLLTGWTEWFQVEGGFRAARMSDSLNGHASALPVDYPWAIPVWLTPITSAFLHAGLFHLAMNMLVLVMVGRMIEAALGTERFVVLYTAGIIAAAAMHYAVDPLSTTPVVGASGAISALLAAYFLLFSRRKPQAIGPVPGLVVHIAWLAAAWTGINLLSQFAFAGSALGIAIWAHIGGFIAGLVLAVPLARNPAVRRPRHDVT
ncbi:rhomboid family intramembrane serine protease [Blastomonas sp.]|uniref:rhomboid family intramembrane serine protease n=1 Tax=Blastomonas sp. TaxID=1909299 RepID=UPI00261677E7|nr:rhomboid family intramembrane serine protease [Blastomonas sp.]MDM7955625.1 rhomboid family intramembrane serine protease [Blastomonas sp.]